MTKLELAVVAKTQLIEITNSFSTTALIEACKVVLYHPKFITQIGSLHKHHAYEGGLAIHTFEVTEYAMKMAAMFSINPEVVATAAIFHDFMKVKEYTAGVKEYTAGIQILMTPYRSLIRHVAGSHAEFMKAIDGKNVSEEVVVKIEHAILAHHGRKEFGSPVEPQLLDAYILHVADMYSANFGPQR